MNKVGVLTMDEQTKVGNENRESVRGKKRMSFARFANLLYEASSSLVPGTGELYSTQYTNEDNNEKADSQLDK
jgi:hypothetical protein